MGTTKGLLPLAGCLFLTVLLASPADGLPVRSRLSFSGGPEGGTFHYFSSGIATCLSRSLSNVEVSNLSSAGSVENVQRVNSGEADFSIAYSGDTCLARDGRLANDVRKYENVYAVASLYGAPAHLIVLQDSGINKVGDLAGKHIAVGGAGSGAATSAQRYFCALGLWDKMKIDFIGYSKAASALDNGLIDAMWILAGIPNGAVIEAATSNKIRIISTWDAGEEGGAFEQYPFYTPVIIPAGTYNGVDYEVKTFQDRAFWVAGKHVPADIVYQAVRDIFSPEGLSYMCKVRSTANAMSVEGALTGIAFPIHEGAMKFWMEKGLSVAKMPKP